MQLNSISIEPKSIIMRVLANKETDDSNDTVDSKITAKEEPLPSLTKAWAGLAAVFVAILELDDAYTTGLTVTKMSIRRTKAGTRSVILHGTKQLECRSEFLHVMDTPCIQVDAATDGESGSIEIDKKLATAVHKAIHESERYMDGERSQKLLDFDDAKAALQATADIGKDLLAGGH